MRTLTLSVLALVACTSQRAVYEPVSIQSARAQPHAADALMTDVAACWLGGIWGDVQGETPAERERASEQRCERVIVETYGESNRRKFLQLRAFVPETLDEVRAKIGWLAINDPIHARHE